jgi:hypothetical protein
MENLFEGTTAGTAGACFFFIGIVSRSLLQALRRSVSDYLIVIFRYIPPNRYPTPVYRLAAKAIVAK